MHLPGILLSKYVSISVRLVTGQSMNFRLASFSLLLMSLKLYRHTADEVSGWSGSSKSIYFVDFYAVSEIYAVILKSQKVQCVVR